MLTRVEDARIREAEVTFQLHLSYSRLRCIDSRVWALNQITLLDLGHNSLTALPAEVGHLMCLQELWVNHNPLLTALPPEIAACKQLVQLDARATGIVKVRRQQVIRALFTAYLFFLAPITFSSSTFACY